MSEKKKYRIKEEYINISKEETDRILKEKLTPEENSFLHVTNIKYFDISKSVDLLLKAGIIEERE